MSYTRISEASWPDKYEKRMPDHQKMLPLWEEDTSKWKKYLTLTKRREYMFQSDWIAYIPCLGCYGLIPGNFVHDWASIPGLLRVISAPDGVLAPFAPFHDLGYRVKGLYLASEEGESFTFTEFTRKQLDQALYDHNMWHNDLPAIHKPAHAALTAFGWMNFGQRSIDSIDWTKPVYSK